MSVKNIRLEYLASFSRVKYIQTFGFVVDVISPSGIDLFKIKWNNMIIIVHNETVHAAIEQ